GGDGKPDIRSRHAMICLHGSGTGGGGGSVQPTSFQAVVAGRHFGADGEVFVCIAEGLWPPEPAAAAAATDAAAGAAANTTVGAAAAAARTMISPLLPPSSPLPIWETTKKRLVMWNKSLHGAA
ncbi:unnamed protein product, partial [Phaeothamnion confervicola]